MESYYWNSRQGGCPGVIPRQRCKLLSLFGRLRINEPALLALDLNTTQHNRTQLFFELKSHIHMTREVTGH